MENKLLDRLYVVASEDDADPEESVWTLSNDPERTGWETDSGFSGYGLPKSLAMAIASAWNARIDDEPIRHEMAMSDWQSMQTAPKDGTRIIGALYWPTLQTYKRFAETVLKEPVPGVTYNYIAETFWHDGAWHVAPLNQLIDQDSIYAMEAA